MRIFGLAVLLLLGVIHSALAQNDLLDLTKREYPSRPDHVTSRSQLEDVQDEGLGAAAGTARSLIPLALDLIKGFEGWDADMYEDVSGFCTIGYGHLVNGRSSCKTAAAEFIKLRQEYPQSPPLPPLTDETGSKLLEKDSGFARAAVERLVKVPLSDKQFGALSSFVFNVGSKGFAGSTMLKYINKEEHEAAARQFALWVVSGGERREGLVTRRDCEASLYLGKLKYDTRKRKGDTRKKIDRRSCGGLGAAAPSGAKEIDISVGEGR
jgi:lysozyme